MRSGLLRSGSRVGRAIASGTVAAAVVLGGCAPDPAPPAADVPRFDVEIVGTSPHDTGAFTQGLEIDGDRLLEGTGREGRSRVTASDRETGDVLTEADLPAPLFGEGITVAGDTVWQLTWQDGIAVARDRETLLERRRVDYDGEGWGLCLDESSAGSSGRLVMSDGTDTLTFRDPVTFEPTGTVRVTQGERPVTSINELECTADGVYANIWKTDDIVRIDPSTGAVTAIVDASPLRAALDDTSGIDVLNGIAAVPGTSRFLVTGKLWPTLFEVEFRPR
ncbi:MULTISPECIES: glutaminyl-peptide cyclotransferase [Nocardiaceae]|uniref:Glutamine cyclotransferase n=1 Tax=Rhodococcoides corynebacterioides TaxID=53972 RepID=A0ABS2KP58_9NOCA|nr:MULTISPECIES: glutaminyl-peptide cyclotransferase [Rhodococcus]MBM7413613.1 glutamine cyclotransferase [Rhodococcus corynebacterioides]MBP1116076.1 glutamine cyclotransferase [Rhodococcus sp. PvP016]